jgi:putative membrane protein
MLAACALAGSAAGAGAQQHILVQKERPAMSDSAIVAHMAIDDSLEITIAKLAAIKGTEQRVRDFATILATDHEAHLASTARVIENEHVVPQASANDPQGTRLREMLAWLDTATAGTAWDAAFLRFQVAHHQSEIAALNANSMNAYGGALADHMRRSLVSLAKHRDLARSVATTLGVSLP